MEPWSERERFFELSRDLLCIAGADGRFRDVNSAWEQALGWSRDELCSRPFVEFVHPDDIEATIAETSALQSRSETIDFENRYRRKDGGYVWLSWNVTSAATGPDGSIYAVARDVTSQKDAAAIRQDQIERLRQYAQIVEATDEGVWVLDEHGKTVLINAAAERMTGWSPEDIVGQISHHIIHHSYPDGTPYPILECPIYKSVFQGEAAHVSDEVFWRKDGTSFPVVYTTTPVIGDGGRKLGAVQIFHDATHEITTRESERRLRDAELGREQAFRINDSILQQLIVAQLNLDEGATAPAAAALNRAISSARAHVTDLLGGDITPGDLRLTAPQQD